MRPICICIAIIFALVSIPTSGAETPYQTGVLFDSPKVKASDYTEFCLDRDGFLDRHEARTYPLRRDGI